MGIEAAHKAPYLVFGRLGVALEVDLSDVSLTMAPKHVLPEFVVPYSLEPPHCRHSVSTTRRLARYPKEDTHWSVGGILRGSCKWGFREINHMYGLLAWTRFIMIAYAYPHMGGDAQCSEQLFSLSATIEAEYVVHSFSLS